MAGHLFRRVADVGLTTRENWVAQVVKVPTRASVRAALGLLLGANEFVAGARQNSSMPSSGMIEGL